MAASAWPAQVNTFQGSRLCLPGSCTPVARFVWTMSYAMRRYERIREGDAVELLVVATRPGFTDFKALQVHGLMSIGCLEHCFDRPD